jgi:hypothetical protein
VKLKYIPGSPRNKLILKYIPGSPRKKGYRSTRGVQVKTGTFEVRK